MIKQRLHVVQNSCCSLPGITYYCIEQVIGTYCTALRNKIVRNKKQSPLHNGQCHGDLVPVETAAQIDGDTVSCTSDPGRSASFKNVFIAVLFLV